MAERVFRDQYREPAFFAERVDLNFDIRSRAEAIVTARIALRRSRPGSAEPIRLDGEGLADATLEASLDGSAIDWRSLLSPDGRSLCIPCSSDRAEFACRVRLDPSRNLALEGLYASESGLFTQCEAEGFRRIAWSVDRPDSLPLWSVRIEAELAEFPVLLSNGPRSESGSSGSRHWARFEDPFPKPTYLFALVACDLARLDRKLALLDGREATLSLWAKPSDLPRLSYAMEALEQSILWDRRRFGLDLDLAEYHVVAVPDFNMGAMENKGLNIFNSKALLADASIATDEDHARVQAIVAHEYFHNWTGNRATVRDWFELTLKEGLTVYRDQEFSSDMRSRPEQRVRQALDALARQFPEDAGPLRHCPRPRSYERVDNFYTSTVYEKGAEIVRCLENLVGTEAFTRGVRLYLSRNDGKAGVCEDFSNAVREASGDPLPGFERWWDQSGTPRIRASVSSFDPALGMLRVEMSQSAPAQEGGSPASPLLIPVGIALAYRGWLVRFRLAGSSAPFGREAMLRLCEPRQSFLLQIDPSEGALQEAPDLSLLRGFSAPAILEDGRSPASAVRLALAETDSWALKSSIDSLMLASLGEILREAPGEALESLAQALSSALSRAQDGFLRAHLLALPSDESLASSLGGAKIHPLLFWRAKRSLRREIASRLRPALDALAEPSRAPSEPYSPDGAQAAGRAARWSAMSWLAECPGAGESVARSCREALARADNLTDRLGAISALCLADPGAAEEALAAFRDEFGSDPLLLDKWLSLIASPGFSQEGLRASESAFLASPALWLNPNRARALASGLLRNPEAFHRADGRGYELLATLAASIDSDNPKSAAGLLRVFAKSSSLQEEFAQRMRLALQARCGEGMSEESSEIVSLILGRSGE